MSSGGAGTSRADPPASASARAYLRSGLPSVYLEEEFGMRFISALEVVLDPVVDTLDSLFAQISPELAPEPLVMLLGWWLGLPLDEDTPLAARRALVRNGAELMRRRGTTAGLQLLLELTFPDVPLRVQDGGAVTVHEDGPPLSAADHSPGFVVSCAESLDPRQRASIIRTIERERPVHVSYRLQAPADASAAEGSEGA